MMTEQRTRSVRRLRSEDMERRARRAKRESNWATARSSRAKLVRTSVAVGSAGCSRYFDEAKSMAWRCVSHILRGTPGVLQVVQTHREVKGALPSAAMEQVRVLTGDGLLLRLLGRGLLGVGDDALHAVRHGCRACACDEM